MDADVGYQVGLCVGTDSKANCELKEKECYEWSLIFAKDSRGKTVGHICGCCVFAISGQYLHLISAYAASGVVISLFIQEIHLFHHGAIPVS